MACKGQTQKLNMTTNNTSKPFYLFETDRFTEHDRLVLQHEVFRPRILQLMTRVLDEYGLGEQLVAAQTSGERIQILDIGCGLGLFLHDLAELLEQRGWLEVADLVGIDRDQAIIYTADEYRKASKPPRPCLQFYIHDASEPLEASPDLTIMGLTKFNFIFATSALEYLSDARYHLQRFYQALKPGGVIYLRSVMTTELPENSTDPAEGWTSFNPSLVSFYRHLYAAIAAANNGVDIALEEANWLREVGAEQVEAAKDIIIGNTASPEGVKLLRLWVSIFQSAGKTLAAKGILCQAEYDKLLQIVFRETGPQSNGHAIYVDTLARKPLHEHSVGPL